MSTSVRLRQLRALLKPAPLGREVRRLRRKWTRRLLGTERRRVTIEPEGEPRGDVLLSYVLDPFLLPAGRTIPLSHTHYWESWQIARNFAELGYRVDVVSWQNTEFRPVKRYRAAVDVRLNLERWAQVLPADCVKIMHAETAHWSFHNRAERERLQNLYERRGVRLREDKMIAPNRTIESADCVTILGNEFTCGTYRFADKPLFRIPISTPVTYDELERSFDDCRRHFLWFGGSGLVHKGLDLVLEAFAGMPDLHLTVCGPVQQERDFERAYYRELYDLPNVHTHGWVDVASDDFRRLCGRALALIYPSCSEGQCGGVITCMHAGLIPVVSYETGVPVDDFGVLLADCEVPTLRAAIRELSSDDAAVLRERSRKARAYARQNHTRERFAAVHRAAIEEILESFPGRPAAAGAHAHGL